MSPGSAGIVDKFLADTRGNIAILFGVVIFVVLGGAGIAIDTQRSNLVRAEIQEATDSSLIAATRYKAKHPSATDAELTGVARRLFDRSLKHADIVNITAFELSFDSNAEVFDLTVDGTITTLIMQVFGEQLISVNTASQAKLGKPPYIELVMALDVTGSMSSHNKISTMRNAARDLVASLFSHPEAKVKIGVVPFAQYVSIGAAQSGASWLSEPAGWMGCVGSRTYPDNVEDDDFAAAPVPGVTGQACAPDLLPLSEDEAAIDAMIGKLKPFGMTYIPSGLSWAWRLLSPQEPFTEGVEYSALASMNGIKALILMTDGMNTASPTFPLHNGANQNQANDLTEELCTNIDAEDIIIYTIAFEVTDSVIRGILENCATTPSHYFKADNAQDLVDAFEDIATSLRNITLSK